MILLNNTSRHAIQWLSQCGRERSFKVFLQNPNTIPSILNMKPKTLKTILLAAALAPAALFADTATTTPVGYVTITTPASSDATVTLPLQRAALLKTAVSSVAGNVVTFASAGISADAFVNSPATYTKSYLLVTSGPLAGERYPVTANTATTVTVDAGTTLQTAGLLAGATFSVIPNWTLGTAFPAGAGVGASQDLSLIHI